MVVTSHLHLTNKKGPKVEVANQVVEHNYTRLMKQFALIIHNGNMAWTWRPSMMNTVTKPLLPAVVSAVIRLFVI